MKQELSPKLVVGAIAAAVIVVIGVLAFFAIRSDPAMRGPLPPMPVDRSTINEADYAATRDRELQEQQMRLNGGAPVSTPPIQRPY